MAERKPEWPEAGCLKIVTLETGTDFGAYAKLNECNKHSLLHVSEFSLSCSNVTNTSGQATFRREK